MTSYQGKTLHNKAEELGRLLLEALSPQYTVHRLETIIGVHYDGRFRAYWPDDRETLVDPLFLITATIATDFKRNAVQTQTMTAEMAFGTDPEFIKSAYLQAFKMQFDHWLETEADFSERPGRPVSITMTGGDGETSVINAPQPAHVPLTGTRLARVNQMMDEIVGGARAPIGLKVELGEDFNGKRWRAAAWVDDWQEAMLSNALVFRAIMTASHTTTYADAPTWYEAVEQLYNHLKTMISE